MAEHGRAADQGFTLIEVIIVTVLLGLMSLVIGFAITTMLRVTPIAESQVTNARSIQGLTAWFAADAASAVAASPNVTPNPGLLSLSCAGSESTPGGTNLVEFQWTDAEPSPTTFVSAYRLEPDGTGHAVRRYECTSSTSPPFNDTSAHKLTGPLANVATVTANTPSYDRISLELQSLDGTAIRIEATPRSPDAALPTTTTPATLAPPTPCSATFASSSYSGLINSIVAPVDKLANDVDLTMSLNGDTCGLITIEYDPGDGNGLRSQLVAVSGLTGDVTIPQGTSDSSTPTWTTGSHPIRVFNNCSTPCAEAPLDTTSLDLIK